jgi:hypothetical protein
MTPGRQFDTHEGMSKEAPSDNECCWPKTRDGFPAESLALTPIRYVYLDDGATLSVHSRLRSTSRRSRMRSEKALLVCLQAITFPVFASLSRPTVYNTNHARLISTTSQTMCCTTALSHVRHIHPLSPRLTHPNTNVSIALLAARAHHTSLHHSQTAIHESPLTPRIFSFVAPLRLFRLQYPAPRLLAHSLETQTIQLFVVVISCMSSRVIHEYGWMPG